MNKSQDLSQKARIILQGMFVADAAALGLHWLYDKKKLKDLEGVSVAFQDPNEKTYEGVFGYFAHGKKKSGDLSHYGSTLQLMLFHLLKHGSTFDIKAYQKEYRDYFGPGGDYVGFVDNPTRITLENLAQYDYKLTEQARELSRSLPDDVAKVVVQKVLPYLKKFSGEDLIIPVKNAIEITYPDPEVIRVALKMAESLDKNYLAKSGADDQQIPALSGVVPVVLMERSGEDLDSLIEKVVRVTNNNDVAVMCAQFFAQVLKSYIEGTEFEASIEGAKHYLPDEVRKKIERTSENIDAPLFESALYFGRTCYLPESLPLSIYILRTSHSFEEAVERNIKAGGDSCGRSLVVGALGALKFTGDQGCPNDWWMKVKLDQEVAQLF
ncbi:MAG: ADP-ribosylglycohydrolase family protein [Bdellovibrionales bacterium]|nr:ADP-ribosylglycohydrolase family protein [Bdellovibrionales bacterium]